MSVCGCQLRRRTLRIRTQLRKSGICFSERVCVEPHSSQLPSGGWLFFISDQNGARQEISKKKYASNSRRGSVHREISEIYASNSRRGSIHREFSEKYASNSRRGHLHREFDPLYLLDSLRKVPDSAQNTILDFFLK